MALRTTLSLTLALSFFSLAAFASGKPDGVRILLSRSLYFSVFNYHDAAKHELAQTLEADMTENAERILVWAKAHPGVENADAGMYLVYTGMLILDRNNGFREGVLTQNAPTIPELLDRYRLAQVFLDAAQALSPKDTRIPSWAAANAFRMEKLEHGSVSDATLDRIVALAEKSPIFHLFNALTMSSDMDFGLEREAKLLALSELMNGKDSPCWPPIFRTGEAKQCKTTKKTPYAFQGVTVYLGDSFLKKAVRDASVDPASSEAYLSKALKAYQRLTFFLFKRKTKRWEQYPNLQERIRMVRALQRDKAKPDARYLATRSFLDIYTCYGCHQEGRSRRKLDVKLPFYTP